jgi:hypothetical protein
MYFLVCGACMKIATMLELKGKMHNTQHAKDLFEEKNKLDKKYTKFIGRYQIADRCL